MGVTVLDWHHLTGPALQALDRKRTIVVVSCSPLEVHGPHLPLFADIRQGEGLLTRGLELLAEMRNENLTCVRLPWMWMATDVLPHVGSIHFEPSTVARVVEELGTSLGRQGFRHVWIGNFHGGPRHILALELGAERAWKKTGVGMISVFSLLVQRLTGGSSDLASLLGGIGGITREDLKGDSHGGLVETAMLLHLAGRHVDPGYEKLPRRSIELELEERGAAPLQKGEKATVPELVRGFPLKARYFERETYAGDPSRANADVGQQYLDRIAAEAASALDEVYSGARAPNDCHSPLWPLRHVMMSTTVGKIFDRIARTRPSPV